jgi:hypothetical protein
MTKGPAKSLREYRAAAIAAEAENGDPWACRACGCRDWRVRDSRLTGAGPRKRERVCRNCGEPLTTMELPVPPDHQILVQKKQP